MVLNDSGKASCMGHAGFPTCSIGLVRRSAPCPHPPHPNSCPHPPSAPPCLMSYPAHAPPCPAFSCNHIQMHPFLQAIVLCPCSGLVNIILLSVHHVKWHTSVSCLLIIFVTFIHVMKCTHGMACTVGAVSLYAIVLLPVGAGASN